MSTPSREASRRSLLGSGLLLGLGASAASVTGTRAASIASLARATMMVAGPADASTARLAKQLAAPLSATLHPGLALSIASVGGRDGVTGANAFEALTNPDGSTALLVPGLAAMAWLAGDQRVHFDPGQWVPALTSVGSSVLVGRAGPHPATLRVAASTRTGIELAALLGLSLLGSTPVPVFGLADPADAQKALSDGRVDAILLTGRDVPMRYASLCGPQSGAALQAIFSLGSFTDAGTRDPALMDVPTLPELFRDGPGQAPQKTLFKAWKATAAAARLDAALVLQPLAPASMVAQWRVACSNAVANRALARDASAGQLDPLPAPACVSAMSAMIPDENTLLALRSWVASRTDWRPA